MSADLLSYSMGLAVGYLMGSIPFGLLLTRAAGLGDVRNIGSGNIGATNVLRTGRKGLAALTLLLDALKAAGAVWLMRLVSEDAVDAGAGAALGAFLGHLFPVWLGFRGGKGIAVYVGALLALTLWGLVAFALVWLGSAYATRYSSLSALLATVAAPLAAWFGGAPAIAVATLFAMTAVTWWAHRENIARLRAGTEGRIGER